MPKQALALTKPENKTEKKSIVHLPTRFVDVMLVMDTGTVVTFFFTRVTDLFAVTMFALRGNVSVNRDRRVLTFPSGFFGGLDL